MITGCVIGILKFDKQGSDYLPQDTWSDLCITGVPNLDLGEPTADQWSSNIDLGKLYNRHSNHTKSFRILLTSLHILYTSLKNPA